ncbi:MULTISPECIES: cytochrome c3 family protein [unclassified Marinovum]
MTLLHSILRVLAPLALANLLGTSVPAEPLPEALQNVLSEFDVPVTQGAAPNYVPDAVCGTCHADKAESFAEVGMGKSFYRPSPNTVIEDFTLPPFVHAPSGRTYRIEMRGEHYWFRRWRRSPEGAEVDVFERRIDWIMGSGHHSRVYLYQTLNGTLFQLPLAWYAQEGKWAMAPGYEFADHLGIQRQVPQRCMGCHNGLPDVPEGSDLAGHPNFFPTDLPEGIGCQRCHGPGARHVATAFGGAAEPEAIRAEIVNPAKLPPDQTYAICYGCHLQPSVAVNSDVRFGRGQYSFRPGQALTDFLVHLDIEDGNQTKSERFDINHHPYRLEQSQCFIESEGALGCLSCHDPHVKRKPQERAAHYRAACLTCHDTDTAGQVVAFTPGLTHPEIAETDDCTACHMPPRRTQDVIEVWMTDHNISRAPAEGLLRPIPKIIPDVRAVRLHAPGTIPADESLMQKTRAVLELTGHGSDEAEAALEQALAEYDGPAVEPWLALAEAKLAGHDTLGVIIAAKKVLALAPDNPSGRSLLASAYIRGGALDKAEALLGDLLRDHPGLANDWFNLALVYLRQGQETQAIAAAREALAQQDTHWRAQRLIARIEAGRGNQAAAIESYLAALALEPRADDVRAPLVKLLTGEGRLDEADRYAE